MIITTHFNKLKEKCIERGWTLEEVMDCVISQNGDRWKINTNHQSYPMYHKSGRVGSELKKLLSILGIKSGPNCSCNQKASYMDKMGVEWCEQNIDTIVGWLNEEASKRGLPFVSVAAKLLVYRAIRNVKYKK